MHTITIYGPGCIRCTQLAQLTLEIIREQHWDATLVKETDAQSMAHAGVLTTPALAVNGTLLLSGKVPAKGDLLALLLPVLDTPAPQPACTCGGSCAEVPAGDHPKPATGEKSACTCPCRSESTARPKWEKILVWIVLALLALATVKLINRHAAAQENEPASGPTSSRTADTPGSLETAGIPAAPRHTR